MAMLLLWILCGWVNYGVSMSYFQNRFQFKTESSWEQDRVISMAMAIAGPLAIPAVWFNVKLKYIDLRYMFKWKNPFIEVK